MNQMMAPEARIVARQPYENIVRGFMRERGRIFFLEKHGGAILRYPVMADGTILPRGDIRFPLEVVSLVDPGDLGITTIRWAT